MEDKYSKFVPDFLSQGKGTCRLEVVGANVTGGRDRASLGDLLDALKACGIQVEPKKATQPHGKPLRVASKPKKPVETKPLAKTKLSPKPIKAAAPKSPKRYTLAEGSTRTYGPVAKLADVMQDWGLTKEATIAKIEHAAKKAGLSGDKYTVDVDGVRASKFSEGRYLLRFKLPTHD